VIETAQSGSVGEHTVAKWVAAEADARGFEVQPTGIDELSTNPSPQISRGDVVLMILHPVSVELMAHDATVPWERWAELARTIVNRSAGLILVAAGAQAAGAAACLRAGAYAVVDIDWLGQVLDTIRDRDRRRGLAPTLRCPFAVENLNRLIHLTTIELRVLFYMTMGYSADRIASVQCISTSTVRAHIRSILRKLSVNSQLAAVAIANGTVATASAPQDGASNESNASGVQTD
jgi:DNA-binding CsgD family transcriptional regulator